MELQRIAGRNVLGAWWDNNVLIVEDARHQTWAYGGVPECVFIDLTYAGEPDEFFSNVIAHRYIRERVFLASPQLSTIDPATLPF